MIKIQIPLEKDIVFIKKILMESKYENINLKEKINNSMVVYDGNEIIGFASYIIIGNDEKTGIIDIIAIKEEFQGQYIGDSLIKSLLNLADKRGLSRVYAIVEKSNSLFFKKAGFTKRLGVNYEYIKKYIKNNESEEKLDVFEAILPDFFNKSCRSSL